MSGPGGVLVGRASRVIGVEREFTVVGPRGPVPFGGVRPGLATAGWALDPGDPNARRAWWGGQVTADGDHAEAATPPVVLGPGCTRTALDLSASGRRHLEALVPDDHRLVGYSTHLNVEVAPRRARRIATTIAHRLAVPLMLTLDRADSPGILVRPRHGRLEVGGEFAAGAQLRAAMVMAVGVVLVASRACRHPRMLHGLPRLDMRVVPATQRHGWYVDRRAFGVDLYTEGRDAQLPTCMTAGPHRRRGRMGVVAAGDLLQATWNLARPLVADVLDDEEVALGDDLASGDAVLPQRAPQDHDGATGMVVVERDYGPRRRAGFTITIEAATWYRAVVRFDGPGAPTWLTLQGRDLDDWLDRLDDGAHDQWLARLGDRGHRGPGVRHGRGRGPVAGQPSRQPSRS